MEQVGTQDTQRTRDRVSLMMALIPVPVGLLLRARRVKNVTCFTVLFLPLLEKMNLGFWLSPSSQRAARNQSAAPGPGLCRVLPSGVPHVTCWPWQQLGSLSGKSLPVLTAPPPAWEVWRVPIHGSRSRPSNEALPGTGLDSDSLSPRLAPWAGPRQPLVPLLCHRMPVPDPRAAVETVSGACEDASSPTHRGTRGY